MARGGRVVIYKRNAGCYQFLNRDTKIVRRIRLTARANRKQMASLRLGDFDPSQFSTVESGEWDQANNAIFATDHDEQLKNCISVTSSTDSFGLNFGCFQLSYM